MPERLLFTPLLLREVRLRNRIVVPPMHPYSAVKGFPTDWHLINAGKFAAGGAGLVIIESTKDHAGWGPGLAKTLVARGVDVIDCSSGGISDAAPILGRGVGYNYQVPLSDYVRGHAAMMTIAVGLIIHGDQAEQILQHGQADLIAVGREILNNPNWPMDAALKLGVEAPFRHVAAIRLLARHPRQARLRHETLDLAIRSLADRFAGRP
jgi:2,4-dienoyl-CoA reductase-like NADH-dependent reductase (Old Yellow Enzyme family)